MRTTLPLKRNQEIEITIRDLAFGGVGIGKIPTEEGEFAVFVENAIPGQVVKAMVVKSRKRHAECALIEVLHPSPDEVPTPYQSIPGAPYATLPIELQAALKKRTTLDLYKRIGKIPDIEQLFDEYIESPSVWHYRNKMEYSFAAIRYDFDSKTSVDDFALGFKHRGTWWMVENLDADSGLFDPELETKLKDIRTYCIGTNLPPWHAPQRTGFFRFLVVRKSFASDKLLINLVTSDSHLAQFDVHAFGEEIKSLLGNRVAGLIHTINPDVGDRVDPLNGSSHLVFGDEKIIERINGLDFEISMSSFFQTNPRCAELLYNKALEYADIKSDDDGMILLDLFCGTGTIAQLLASRSKRKVVGVDIVESAVADAQKNAQRNGITNIEFIASDVGKFLSNYPEYAGKISCVVLDPPRGGIAPRSLQKVIALDAQRIVYVSCNPSTQARDAEVLAASGYELKRISLVDQFPHTAHIEAVGVWEK